MNYSTDRAIKSLDEDLLGRASFSRQLGKAIYEYSGKDSLVIAIYGRWGTGKTSVANMALQTIEELSKDDKKKSIIIRFAPWNYSDKDNLISQFFASLKVKIDLDSNEELRNKVGKALSDYSSVFDFASLVPVVGGPLASMLKNAAKAGGEALAKNIDLETSKARLEKALLEVNQKIVILIDDIDRLTNSQIRDIFQLVKQVGDLPNVTYILAMDREVVRRALAEVHNTDGNEYLDKIIQIPFEIPELKKSKLHEIFFTKLDMIIKELSGEIQWDQKYWSKVFENCISPYLNTLRDVNRVINTFQFRYSMLYEETSFEDMIGITTLEVLEPSLYKWIAENKDAVCGRMMHGLLSNNKKPGEYKTHYEEEFRLLGLDPGKATRSVATIFPVFANDVAARFYETDTDVNVRAHMRAAQPDRFDLYFMFDMETVKVPRSVINSCVFLLSEEDLRRTIADINNEGNIFYFLDEIKHMADIIPNERLKILSSVLWDIGSGFDGVTTRAVFTISACEIARHCAEDFINRIETQEERYEIYRKGIQMAGKEALGSIAYEIRRFERAYGRFSDAAEEKEEQLISLDQLVELENLFLDRISKIGMSYTEIETVGFLDIYFLWEDLDKESAQNYLKKGFEDIVFKLKFLCRFASRWNGIQGYGWCFNQSYYKNYLNDDDVYKEIADLDKSKLDQFAETEQVKLASFVLNYKKDEMDYVDEKMAKSLVSKWKVENSRSDKH